MALDGTPGTTIRLRIAAGVPDSGQFDDHLAVLGRGDGVEVALRVVVSDVTGEVAAQSAGADPVGAVGPTKVGTWKAKIALELREPGQALEAAKTVHPELLATVQQAEFWADVGRALVTEKKTRDKAVGVLLHAERLAPQRIRHDVIVREMVVDLLRQARRDAGGRELRGLAWRMGIAPLG